MKHFLVTFLIISGSLVCRGQRIDSIFFNLYTDSLKKGVYNYINVDGKLAGGGFLPLTTDEVSFASTAGKWDHNSIIFDKDFTADSVVITVKLKNDTSVKRTTTVYMKKIETEGRLKTKEEILEDIQKGTRRKGRK